MHAGDLTYRGSINETEKELKALGKHRDKFKSILFVEGNHDWLGARNPVVMGQLCQDNGISLLRDSSIEIEGVKFYGTPWQPEFCNWAFNLPRGEPLKEKWAAIPEDTQVLITHGPPMNILDEVDRLDYKACEYFAEHVGCWDLKKRIEDLKLLKLHVFGHIHKGYGKTEEGPTTFINASICNEEYNPVNVPFVHCI